MPIGTLREGPLHAALKRALALPGDRLEVAVGRHVIDIVRADGELVELQTGGFAALGPKLDALLDHHRIRIVAPIAAERRIVRVDRDGEVTSTRRSPRRSTALEIFDRLVAFPALLSHPHLTVEILLAREDQVRAPAPGPPHGPARRRRRAGPCGERRLLEVLERIELRGAADAAAFLPVTLAEPFGTRELAAALGCGVTLAQRVAYCLAALEVIEPAGRLGRGRGYRRSPHCVCLGAWTSA